MSRRWLRLDAQWDDSEWVMMLGPLSQLGWIKLLCYVKRDGRRGTASVLSNKAAAKKWGIPVQAVGDMIFQARQDGALRVVVDEGGKEKWVVTNWAEYQEPDGTALERKRKQRARVGCHGDVTPVTPPSRRDTVARDHRPPTTDGGTATDAITSEGEPRPSAVEKSEVGREGLASEQRRDSPVSASAGIAPEAPAPSPTFGEVMAVVRAELSPKDPKETDRSGSILRRDFAGKVAAQDVIDACRGARKLIEAGLVDGVKPGQSVGLRFLRTWKHDSRLLWDAAVDHERFAQASAPPTNARGRATPLRVAVSVEPETRRAG